MPAVTPDAGQQPIGFKAFLALFASIMVPMFLATIDQTIVAAALPAIAGDLGGVDRVSWVVIAYLVAATVAAPVYGRLGDLLGRRRLLFVALTVVIAASALCGLAQSVEMLTVFRVLQGLGGGRLMALSQALIGEAVAPRHRVRYQGITATIGVSSGAFGAVAGGFLTEHFGWRSVFFVGIPIGLVAIGLALRLPARPGTGKAFRFDTAGALLFAIFISAAMVMLHSLQEFDTRALLPLVGLLSLAVAAALALVWREKRAADPLLPLGLLRNPTIWRADALAACHGGVLVSLLTFLPIYLRVVHGAAAGSIGLLLLPVATLVSVGSMLTGWMVSRTGRTAIFPSVGLLAATLLLLILALTSPYLELPALAGLLAVNALFMGTVMGVVQVTVQSSAGPGFLGTAAASVQFSRSLGSALGTAVVGAVLFAGLSTVDIEAGRLFGAIVQEGPDALAMLSPERQAAIALEIAGAFRAAFLTMAVIASIGLVLAWSLPLRRI
jgi:MFS family permease